MANIGYIQVSSQDQNLDRQLEMMSEQNIDKLFQEKISGKDTQRPEFQKLLKYIREGDQVIVTSLDRLGRDYDDIKNTVAFMKQKNVDLKILDAQFLDFNTGSELLDNAMFDMFLSLLSYIAQNEREKIRERQRQGVLLAKQAGRYKGRPTEYSLNSPDPQKKLVYKTVVDMLKAEVPVAEIAKENGLSRPTVYKIKKTMNLDDKD
ncbi:MULTISPECIES: recombinase family protein [Lactococcus]|jgi:DNA invertase Pin-like site-specific DNA recombinase|uniref:recombinase family protein n=1 Tax=Lactococcus TaxID=1357 RepID=UPI000266B7D6|nr:MULTISPECIES: recombinase family protein [Lactococcus]EIT67555.1 Recombinase [Lactococcus garvieae IPLA 31405]MBS4464988.1 recombinase family protein [Lactococcus garvieae]UHU66452.1 helix-turn-helix domain-containing protein [Lactococcus garvieae]UQU60726.1 Putative transposon Tn552 DNA-invertase bin3 [Lactococcus petauri]